MLVTGESANDSAQQRLRQRYLLVAIFLVGTEPGSGGSDPQSPR